jgi:hypothetical protein
VRKGSGLVESMRIMLPIVLITVAGTSVIIWKGTWGPSKQWVFHVEATFCSLMGYESQSEEETQTQQRHVKDVDGNLQGWKLSRSSLKFYTVFLINLIKAFKKIFWKYC